jgi:REP element-mobilizing transposase RayT
MGQSLAKVLVHLIFSTKNRKGFIAGDLRGELAGYLAGILRNLDCPPLLVGVVEDHVHILFSLSRNHAIKTVVEELKKFQTPLQRF